MSNIKTGDKVKWIGGDNLELGIYQGNCYTVKVMASYGGLTYAKMVGLPNDLHFKPWLLVKQVN